MRDCAQHFERKHQTPRALQLYTKAHDWDAALRLCLRSLDEEEDKGAAAKPKSSRASLLDAAREIAQGILRAADSGEQQGEDAAAVTQVSMEMGQRLAHLLERRGHFPEAVRLDLLRLSHSDTTAPLALARRVLRLCKAHEVPLTEGMIDRILTATAATPSEGKEDDASDGRPPSLLREAAEVCAAQGAHASASRLFTQAGDRRRGLLSLCALGDADGIMRYASAARRPEIFLLAAQHLRESGAWRRDEKVRAAVSEFLVRGKAEEATVQAFEEESGRCRMLMKHV